MADIAKSDKSDDIREAAVKRVTDQGLLADIAKNAEYADARKGALTRLDPAPNAELLGVLNAAIARANTEADPSLLRKIARYALSGQARATAAARVTDESLLADIAETELRQLQSEDRENRRGAAEVLIAIARTKPHLLRGTWDTLANTIRHTDQHFDNSHNDYSVSCHRDNSSHHDSGDGVFRGLTFPKKPTDF